MRSFKKIISAAMAIAVAVSIIGVTSVPASAAKKKSPKLSAKKLEFTQKGEMKTITVKNAGKQKITWKVTSKDPDATPLTYTILTGKKSIRLEVVTGGSGTITCKVGKKKLKCNYKVSLPVVSNFQNLTDYIDKNGSLSTKGLMYQSGEQVDGADTYSLYMYSHNGAFNSIGFDLKGVVKSENRSYSLTFLVSADGTVRSFRLDDTKDNRNDWTASIDEVKASKLSGKNNSIYNIIYPLYQTSTAITSYQKLAATQSKDCLALVDNYLKKKFGYGIDTLGF